MKILNELPKKGNAGRKAIYPYDEWLDGQIRELEVGVDFTAKPISVLASCRGAAEARGMRLRTRYVKDGDEVTGVVIQAYTPEEKTEEPQEEAKEETVISKSNRRPRTRSRA
jgi:hypothetical protein